MIDVKELRMGCRLIKDGIHVTIDGRSIMDIHLGHDAALYEPIPLTPEILEKCGLIRGKTIEDRNVFYSTGAHPIRLEITITGGWLIDNNIIRGSQHLKHLHQLQNLYFALTGTELNYQP